MGIEIFQLERAPSSLSLEDLVPQMARRDPGWQFIEQPNGTRRVEKFQYPTHVS